VTDEPRLEALRARIPHTNFHSMSGVLEHGSRWVVMADPEGNEFCVCDGGVGGG